MGRTGSSASKVACDKEAGPEVFKELTIRRRGYRKEPGKSGGNVCRAEKTGAAMGESCAPEHSPLPGETRTTTNLKQEDLLRRRCYIVDLQPQKNGEKRRLQA